MESSCDLVIIGAGAAGIAAAKTARAAGPSIEVIEAKSRRGGRAHTDRDAFPEPFDVGAMFLHNAGRNPYRVIADQLGFKYWRSPIDFRIHDGSWWLSPSVTTEFERYLEQSFGRIDACGREGRDLPAAACIDQKARWTRLFNANYTSYMAQSPDRVSVFDTSRFENSDENWPVEAGFGTLVSAYGADVDINFDCPAKSIDWGEDEIMVGTSRGMIFCRTVLVTASLAVLQQERIKFFPLLPDWKLAALEGIEMGQAEKVGLHFTKDIFTGLDMHFAMMDWPDAPPGAFHIHTFGRQMATLYIGGDAARDLAAAGEPAMIDYAKELIGRLFGRDACRQINRAKATNWSGDPHIAGAYSVLKPGGGDARAELFRPVEGKIFFAGEATSPNAFSTVHGAHQSGIDAVAAILEELRPDEETSRQVAD